MAGETAAPEVVKAGLAPHGGIGHLPDVLFGDVPPLLHGGAAVLIHALAAGVQAGRAGVQQMDDAAVLSGFALQIVAGDPFGRLG
jgi:hypothetical protein